VDMPLQLYGKLSWYIKPCTKNTKFKVFRPRHDDAITYPVYLTKDPELLVAGDTGAGFGVHMS